MKLQRSTFRAGKCNNNIIDLAGVSKSFRISRLKRELQMVKLSATKCSLSLICEPV